MGGAGGHMRHPFDCPDVNSGQDLIDFFRKSIEWAKTNKPALKIDGVNLSFRLKENTGMPTGYEFVVDRGSMKDLDVQGVTADNANQRFVTKDGSPHGMVGATGILLPIFNDTLPDILDELQQLGMLEDLGPYSKYFNTEFVLKKINVKEYAFDFIAIHSVNDFVPKGPSSREGVEVQYDQALLDSIRDKVKPHALKREFRVYSSITTDLVRDVALEEALNEKFTVVYSSQMRDPEEPGELGIGEGSTKPIKSWLADVSENPLEKVVLISDAMIEKYPKMNKKQFAMAKNIYIEVLKGTAINEIVESAEHIEPAVDSVVVWHATRVLGNAILDSLESDEFGPANEQEGVVIKDNNICGGTRFKFTGNFIVQGLESTFEETKFRTGKLLESFISEPMSLDEQEDGRYVILIPGGFKPPTGGHYSMIKQYEKKSDIMKVYVVTGPKERGGVSLEQSKQIFKIYGGFSDKVEFITADDTTPLTTCYRLMENDHFVSEHSGATFSIGAGNKGDDPKRIRQFAKYFAQRIDLTTADISIYPTAESLEVDGQPASASRMREAYKNGDWELFKKLLPNDSFYDDVVQVLNQQGSPTNESFFLKTSLFSLVDEALLEQEKRKKKPNPWAVCTSSVGRKKKAKYERCVKKIKKKYNIIEQDLAGEKVQELTPEQIETIEPVIKNLVNSFITYGVVPTGIQGIENRDPDQLKQSLVNSIMHHIEPIIDEIMQQKPEMEVSEASGMAAGMGGGYSEPIGKRDYEKIRNAS